MATKAAVDTDGRLEVYLIDVKGHSGAASHLIRQSFVESQKLTSSGREVVVRCPVAVVLAASDTYCRKRGPSCS
jgi:hypothetical protein